MFFSSFLLDKIIRHSFKHIICNFSMMTTADDLYRPYDAHISWKKHFKIINSVKSNYVRDGMFIFLF